jgi:hypothetical protein
MIRLMTEYDAYYLDRRGKTLARFYWSPRKVRTPRDITSTEEPRAWSAITARRVGEPLVVPRLHSLDFPWLYKYRPLWISS